MWPYALLLLTARTDLGAVFNGPEMRAVMVRHLHHLAEGYAEQLLLAFDAVPPGHAQLTMLGNVTR